MNHRGTEGTENGELLAGSSPLSVPSVPLWFCSVNL